MLVASHMLQDFHRWLLGDEMPIFKHGHLYKVIKRSETVFIAAPPLNKPTDPWEATEVYPDISLSINFDGDLAIEYSFRRTGYFDPYDKRQWVRAPHGPIQLDRGDAVHDALSHNSAPAGSL